MTTPTDQPDVLIFGLCCIAIFCFYSFPMVIFSWLSQSNRQLLTPCTGGYRNPLVSHFRGPTSRYWCPNEGSCDPRCRVWGLCGSHPIFMGRDPVPRDPISALYLPCAWSLRRFPTSGNWGCWTCGPFSSLHLATFTWGQVPLSRLLLCVLLSENLWWCHINVISHANS